VVNGWLNEVEAGGRIIGSTWNAALSQCLLPGEQQTSSSHPLMFAGDAVDGAHSVTRQDQLDLSRASLPLRTHRSREVANLFDEALDDRAHGSILECRDDHGPWPGR